MPQEYKLLYQSLINQQVFFPTDDFFINSSPTRPGGSHKAPPSVLAYASSKPAIQGNDPVSDPGLSNMPVSHTASNQPSPVTSNNQNQSLLKPPVQTPPTVSGQGRSVSAPPTPAAPKIVIDL
jgi:hypothetical protein